MKEKSDRCEMCKNRLVFLNESVYQSVASDSFRLKTFHCPVDRDDPCYPNSHYYLKANLENIVHFREYYFDRFSVTVDEGARLTFFHEPDSYNIVKSIEKALEFEEILRYYKAWMMT